MRCMGFVPSQSVIESENSIDKKYFIVMCYPLILTYFTTTHTLLLENDLLNSVVCLMHRIKLFIIDSNLALSQEPCQERGSMNPGMSPLSSNLFSIVLCHSEIMYQFYNTMIKKPVFSLREVS